MPNPEYFECLVDIRELVKCLDNILDDVFDMYEMKNDEANKLIRRMKEKYHLNNKENQ